MNPRDGDEKTQIFGALKVRWANFSFFMSKSKPKRAERHTVRQWWMATMQERSNHDRNTKTREKNHHELTSKSMLKRSEPRKSGKLSLRMQTSWQGHVGSFTLYTYTKKFLKQIFESSPLFCIVKYTQLSVESLLRIHGWKIAFLYAIWKSAFSSLLQIFGWQGGRACRRPLPIFVCTCSIHTILYSRTYILISTDYCIHKKRIDHAWFWLAKWLWEFEWCEYQRCRF
jgi:hypothetical protein